MTVAPTMPTASSAADESSGPGTTERSSATRSTSATNTCQSSEAMMTTSSTSTTESKWLRPRTLSARTTRLKRVTHTAPAMSGIPKSSLRAIAPPTISARSVMMTTSSACAQSSSRPTPGKRSELCSARLLPVTMPSLAARYWMTMAEQLAKTTTHTRA